MDVKDSVIPKALKDIIDDFCLCEGQEKLELLIQYAESLPPLPTWLQNEPAKLDSVPECMTPVFLQAEKNGGKMKFYFNVPAESPMVRGFASFMKQGLDNASPEEVLQIPSDFFYTMGLQEVLSYQRLNGLSAILAHMKQLAVREMTNNH
jgi:cysteine desulfuration protein SufE